MYRIKGGEGGNKLNSLLENRGLLSLFDLLEAQRKSDEQLLKVLTFSSKPLKKICTV